MTSYNHHVLYRKEVIVENFLTIADNDDVIIFGELMLLLSNDGRWQHRNRIIGKNNECDALGELMHILQQLYTICCARTHARTRTNKQQSNTNQTPINEQMQRTHARRTDARG